MPEFTLVSFDADSKTMPSQFAIQERGADGSFIGLYDFDGETIASRNSFPHASWSAVKELGESEDDEAFWSMLQEAQDYLDSNKQLLCQDHLIHLSEKVAAIEGSEYCAYCAKKYETFVE